MARSPAAWHALNPSYRARLQRSGIDETAYVAGASLQAARGQARAEPARHAAARTAARAAGLPSPSTVGRWKRRALGLSVERGDWDQSIAAVRRGESTFDEVQAQIRELEKAHKAFTTAGRPWNFHYQQGPITLRAWGASWGFYH
jgi:hypothetical protein